MRTLLTIALALAASSASAAPGSSRYQVENGWATIEGDILVFPVTSTKSTHPGASVLRTPARLWTNGIVPFTLNPDLPNPAQVREAMRLWTDSTGIQFVERTNQPNWLHIRRGATAGTCSSYVGMQGGEQVLFLGSDCGAVAGLHELGHALGLWHEHTRSDRGAWIDLARDEITPTCIFNFEIAADSQDQGAYDFASVMHYFPYAFSRRGRPTLETKPAGIPVGDVAGLSAGDIAAIRRLYNRPSNGVTVSTFPSGLPILVDGVTYTAPRTFTWAPGETHRIAAAELSSVNDETRLRFARWTDDGPRDHSIVITAATTFFTAAYLREHRVVAPARAKLEPSSPDGFYPERGVLQITAQVAEGLNFWHWRGIDRPNAGVWLEDNSFAVGDTNPRLFAVNMPKNITMETTEVPLVWIQTDPPNLWVEIDGQERRAPIAFRNVFADGWAPGSTHRLSIRRPTQTCRNVCESGNRFVFRDWSAGPGPSLDITAPSNGGLITARFTSQYQIESLPANSGRIVITPPSADGYYDEGILVSASVNVTNPALRFVEWDGQKVDLDLPSGLSGSTGVCALPLQLRADRHVTLIASYGSLNTTLPRPAISAVANAASFARDSIAPGDIITIFGQNLGPASLASSSVSSGGVLDNCLSQTIVTIEGVRAPLLYVSATQLSAIVPFALAGRSSARITVERAGSVSDAFSARVTNATPALFTANSTGRGPGAFLNQDGSLNTSANPADRGAIVILYATGAGLLDLSPRDGEIITGPALPKPAAPVQVLIGGLRADLLYAGSAPGLVAGVLQVNVRLPEAAPAGPAVPVELRVGEASSGAAVTIAIR